MAIDIRNRARRLIKADGTTTELPMALSMQAIAKLIGAGEKGVTNVNLRHMGHPLMVLICDDGAYETDVVNLGRDNDDVGHFEIRPIKALKPVNTEATALYHANCKPGTTHQILGDVVIAPDEDFA